MAWAVDALVAGIVLLILGRAGDTPWLEPLLQLPTLLHAVGGEAAKLAARAWLCRRQWEDWATLGLLYGLFSALTLLLGGLAMLMHAATLALSGVLLAAAASAVLLHAATGRLAAGVARRRGPWVALAVASVLMAVFTLVPSLLQDLRPEQLGVLRGRVTYALLAVHAAFALLVWRMVPAKYAIA